MWKVWWFEVLYLWFCGIYILFKNGWRNLGELLCCYFVLLCGIGGVGLKLVYGGLFWVKNEGVSILILYNFVF